MWKGKQLQLVSYKWLTYCSDKHTTAAWQHLPIWSGVFKYWRTLVTAIISSPPMRKCLRKCRYWTHVHLHEWNMYKTGKSIWKEYWTEKSCKSLYHWCGTWYSSKRLEFADFNVTSTSIVVPALRLDCTVSQAITCNCTIHTTPNFLRVFSHYKLVTKASHSLLIQDKSVMFALTMMNSIFGLTCPANSFTPLLSNILTWSVQYTTKDCKQF